MENFQKNKEEIDFKSETMSRDLREKLISDPRAAFKEAIRCKDAASCLVKTAEIHGHYCPGIALGVMATLYGFSLLEKDSTNSDGIMEDLLALIEVNACFADGVQAVSGCTIGNNSLIFRDLGKHAVTFVSRNEKRGVRVHLLPDFRTYISKDVPEFYPLMDKVIMKRKGTKEEEKLFREKGREAAFAVIRYPFEKLFEYKRIIPVIPDRAPITPTLLCPECGEEVMETKTRKRGLMRNMCFMCSGKFQEVNGHGIVENTVSVHMHRESRGPSSFWMQDPDTVFKELHLLEGNTFLDIGCGTGDYTLRAAKEVGRDGIVYAIDIQANLIESLIKKIQATDLDNIKTMVCDIRSTLPFDNSCIDVCLISTVLHSLDLKIHGPVLFNEIKRILKPDGRLVILECKKEDFNFGPPLHMRISEDEIENLVSEYDFVKENVVDLGYNYLMIFNLLK